MVWMRSPIKAVHVWIVLCIYLTYTQGIRCQLKWLLTKGTYISRILILHRLSVTSNVRWHEHVPQARMTVSHWPPMCDLSACLMRCVWARASRFNYVSCIVWEINSGGSTACFVHSLANCARIFIKLIRRFRNFLDLSSQRNQRDVSKQNHENAQWKNRLIAIRMPSDGRIKSKNVHKATDGTFYPEIFARCNGIQAVRKEFRTAKI